MPCDPFSVLENAIRLLKRGETLRFEGRKLHTKFPFGGPEVTDVMKDIVTWMKYWSWNHGNATFIRVESSISAHGVDRATLFIRNSDGIWDVWPDRVCEVSRVFATDQLLGMFPFFRFGSSAQYPYVLEIKEQVRDGVEYFVVRGALGAKPEQAPDIASNFVYEIDKRDGLPRSLDETTFGGRFVELELDKLEINPPVDHSLFELPNRPRVVATSLSQYVDQRSQGWAMKLLE